MRPSPTTAIVLAVLAFVGIAAFCALAAVVAVPPSLVNLSSSVSDGVTAQRLGAGGSTVDVVVPDGWVVRREGDAAITVDTPDGAMTALVELVDGEPGAVVAEHADLSTPLRSEVLASGRAVFHADAGDSAVVAAVGVLGGALGPSVRVVASVEPPSTMPTYRPALAELLEGVGG